MPKKTKAQARPTSPVEIGRAVRRLHVELTEADRQRAAEEITEHVERQDALRVRLREVTTEYRDEIAQRSQRVRTLRDQLERGTRQRTELVETIYCPDTDRVLERIASTHEALAEREPTPSERTVLAELAGGTEAAPTGEAAAAADDTTGAEATG